MSSMGHFAQQFWNKFMRKLGRNRDIFQFKRKLIVKIQAQMTIQYWEKNVMQLENKVGQQDIKTGAGYESWVNSYQKETNFLQENNWAGTVDWRDPESE